MVLESPFVWAPIHRLESCPTSDGACAMVLTNEAGGKRASKPPAWVHGTAVRTELGWFPGRDPVNPRGGQDCAADVYKQAGITNPREELDVAEIYVPFSWYEPMWMESLGFAAVGEGWKMTESGATSMEGDMPINASGGVLSSNPIGASGMLRFAEAALQVRGLAGEHQVENARKALGHAYGGAAQYFSMWIVGSDMI
jgi:acetyl-CoA C-acetyltransferase